MANITRNFIKGRMNKSVDERLIPNGEYVDALNVRMGSSEDSEIGVIENTKGNSVLTALQYKGVLLSANAKCIGAFEDGANETIYWFVHDSNFPISAEAPIGKIDLIVSFNVRTGIIRYHVTSTFDGVGTNTTLNFNPQYLITGVNMISDLLFFTDDYNPPRFINVKDSFNSPNASGVDYNGNSALLAERLLVIKRPPLYAPSLNLLNVQGEDNNFLEDRYICFAYRYRYADGEYSATSPFTAPAFIPKIFDFSPNSLLNEGMVNSYNAVNVKFNTGGPLVKSIELLFKNAQDGVIKVIDKFNKEDRGYADNSIQDYVFTNSNVFTILQDSEILRLYDNVPRFALGQTMMGNRIIYGNYIDGYNLERNGDDIKIEYSVSLISESISGESQTGSVESFTYSIPSRSISSAITNGVAAFDLSQFAGELKKGSVLTFDLSFGNAGFQPAGNPQPSSTTSNIDISFSFKLTKDYLNVFELATSDEFINKVGSNSPRNIKSVYDPSGDNSCQGITFTDEFNCSIPNNLTSATTSGSVKKYGSAIASDLVGLLGYENNEAIAIEANDIGADKDVIKLILPYMRFVDDVNLGDDTTEDIYEFYNAIFASVTLQSSETLESLHSNRGYEVGLVYLDEFGRSSTGLVSQNNTVKVPCSAAKDKNSIQVTIPTRQIAPEWATNYKFVIKADEENYDVIYSSFYYRTTDANYAYFLLEGENSRKVEEGDRLIVKKDSGGPASSCLYVTVLEKKTFASDEIEPDSIAGTFMKVGTNEINVTEQENASILYGLQRAECCGESTKYGIMLSNLKNADPPGEYPYIYYPMSILDGGNYVDYTVPVGSRVAINLNFYRNGANRCEPITMVLGVWMEANRNYNNMYDFLIGENFQGELDNAVFNDPNNRNFFDTYRYSVAEPPTTKPGLTQNLFWWTDGDGASVPSYLNMIGTLSCGDKGGKRSVAVATISVYRADGAIIFETEPQDALSDVWFESAETYDIDSDGYHQGNVQDQTSSLPAIINTDFYNCFSFGNGAESYKIRDSIVGRTFNLGNRVLTTSEKEYREADRYSDLTYSGVYNEENNVNKLNEFNLGLLNFKTLEQSFGPIQKLFGRETDILTLQEDRISYVLQGKEMITGATGGSALVTVPEVLGKQVARIEEYGISSHPESFVQWGSDKYFTDAKRGAVIQLKGSAAQNEQLTVISEQGMRSWFRDLFIDSIETQKLGGFDPYMDEYVLSSNDIRKPIDEDCIECGTFIGNIIVDELNPYEFCVNVGALVGDLTIDLEVYPTPFANAPFTITYTYGGVTNIYDSPSTPTSATIVLDKNSVSNQIVFFSITNVDLNKSFIDGITVGCPVAEEITIVPITITSDANSGEFIHSEYSWTDGAFISPLHSRLVEFAESSTSIPLVSDYAMIAGPQGAGVIPANSADVTLACTKRNTDDFVFNKNTNNFRYFRSDTLYNNNDAEIQALLSLATKATPIDDTNEPDKYFATFTMPTTGAYLYLIWDYRISTEDDLCFGASISDACCGC